ncbi:MAG TPA: HD domain-containing protein [Anaerolineae bacterium]|nr:HD domain-containing protein [Anaerolineae bacterium]
MNSTLNLNVLPALKMSPEPPPANTVFSVPARRNPQLQVLVDRINADEELWHLWRCANVNAVDRLSLGDHGEVHIRIVANAALRLLRLLRDAGRLPGVVAQHHLTAEDAEVVVVLAAALHDLGLAIRGDTHQTFSLDLVQLKAKELLADLYPIRERTIIVAEVLHAILAQHDACRCLTLEAGVLKVADALDLAEGRSRIGFEHGRSGSPALSASAVDEVKIRRGEQRPVRIEIRMSRSAGIAQADELLRRKLPHSTLADLVEVVARIESESERRLVSLYAPEAEV